jgi:UDP-glucose-4-epimerase GalE
MSKVLVTGGAGYIGSHVAKLLAAEGFTPVTLDNLGRGHAHAVQWGPLERADLLDGPALAAVFARHRPQAVLHFAALSNVGESVADPLLYYRNNVAGSLALVAAMHEAGCGHIVFSSTAATYGTPETQPITEDAPVLPLNPYGASKAMVERILADTEAAHGLRHVALRYFNAAGADPEGHIGEEHDPETHLIPLALKALHDGVPLSVFGDDYPTPDGTCIRDYIHVSDLAQAHLLALRWLMAGRPSRVFNLGNGAGFSVRAVIAAVEAVTGRPVPHRIAPRRAGDPPVLVADATRAREDLGWEPERAALETQIADAWAWFRRTRQLG